MYTIEYIDRRHLTTVHDNDKIDNFIQFVKLYQTDYDALLYIITKVIIKSSNHSNSQLFLIKEATASHRDLSGGMSFLKSCSSAIHNKYWLVKKFKDLTFEILKQKLLQGSKFVFTLCARTSPRECTSTRFPLPANERLSTFVHASAEVTWESHLLPQSRQPLHQHSWQHQGC
jgi:hypothetical protein